MSIKSSSPSIKGTRTAGERGFTLVEIMVVVVILALLAGFLTKGIFGAGDKAKMKITEMKIAKVAALISQYQTMYNEIPRSLQDLLQCASQDSGNPCAPVTSDPEDLKDGWGTPFVYAFNDGSYSYTIRSLGADRREGGTGVNGDFNRTGP
jgi:general secretion pathway protein G